MRGKMSVQDYMRTRMRMRLTTTKEMEAAGYLRVYASTPSVQDGRYPATIPRRLDKAPLRI